jgi:serine/threonine protein kinase
MVGTRISHYKVIEKIGEGGMGEVYRANQVVGNIVLLPWAEE